MDESEQNEANIQQNFQALLAKFSKPLLALTELN